MHGESPARRGPTKAVLGPTNTGKTHLAVERMLGHQSGMIGLPLRLLAREVYEKVVAKMGVASAALITGEEKIIPSHPRYYICTVEAMPLDLDVEFLAVDEIQLAEDPERGFVFTDRLLNARGTEETMFLGAETMRPLIKELIPQATFISRPRFSNLTYTGPRKLSRLPRRSAIVAFSAEAVYSVAELIRRHRGGAAVVMGALSPRTRNAQVGLYQSGDVDFLVATDAIGMGLNMDVNHVAFANLTKFDGTAVRSLRSTETAQIAGRAGRYLNDGTFGTTADAETMSEDLVDQIENHRFDPIRVLNWRNKSLDFGSVSRLIGSLEAPAPRRGLIRARRAIDVRALRALADMPQSFELSRSVASLKRLWDVCQIPDFRKVMIDEHVRLLKNIYIHLMGENGHIPNDWLTESVNKFDRVDGDLDTIANRIAHIRTWTFVANRPGWVEDVTYWRERTRTIEDKLSDALHQRLIQRFIDRRTSVLMKRLKAKDEILAGVTSKGEVTVEGEYVGHLQGLQFVPDPNAQGIHGKALRAAAYRALEPEILARAEQVCIASDTDIGLCERGSFWWRESALAQLQSGQHWLAPQIRLLDLDDLPYQLRERVARRLGRWLDAHLTKRLAAIRRLRSAVDQRKDPQVTGLARGIGYQLIEAFGHLERDAVAQQVRALPQSERATLRRLGVKFGEFHIYVPDLLKPAAVEMLALLWRTASEISSKQKMMLPPAGLCSFAAVNDVPVSFYWACGYRLCDTRAVRIDILERLAELIRRETAATSKLKSELEVSSADSGRSSNFVSPKSRGPKGFEITREMIALLGCNQADMEIVLRELGFAKRTNQTSGGEPDHVWFRRKNRNASRSKIKDSGRARRHNKNNQKNDRPLKSQPSAIGLKSRVASKAANRDSPFAVLRDLNSTDTLNEQ